MRIDVLRPAELGDADLAIWRRLQRTCPVFGNPFLSPEFAVAVAEHRTSARVAVIQDAGEVAGFLPFERRRLGVGKPIGSGFSDYQAVIHEPGLDWSPRDILEGCGLSVLEFDHLAVEQSPFKPHHVAVRPAPAMDLSRGFEGFVADVRRRSRGFVKTTRRLQRKLERELGPLELVYDEPGHEAHELVRTWKSAQYRRSGWPDLFGRPDMRALVRNLLATRSEAFACRCSMLYAGGRPVSGQINLHAPTAVASWIVAYDPDLSRYSPGSVLDLLIAEEAAGRGVQVISLGKGDGMQKNRLGTLTQHVAEGWVERLGAGSALRRAIRTPTRAAHGLVLRTPALRSCVRRGLRAAGAVRGAP